MKPPFSYPGSKRMLAPWIIEHFPPHDTYAEPFAGAASVFFAKPPSRSEYLNDLNGHIVRFFRTLREQPEDVARAVALTPYSRAEFELDHRDVPDRREHDVEFARRFVVRHQMSRGGNSGAKYASGWKHNGRRSPHGGAIAQWLDLPERALHCAERLREAFIECRPAIELIDNLNAPGVLLYVDPPYPRSVRQSSLALYEYDMLADEQHAELLDILKRHEGPVVLSGYDCALYNDHLTGWTQVRHPAIAQGGDSREESLWLNPRTAAHLRTLQQAPARLL